MYTIIFKQEDGPESKVFADTGANLLELAQQAGVAIDAPCSGNGTCGKCRVRIMSGSVESKQTMHITDDEWEDNWRLACQSTVSGDASIWVPATAADFKKGIRTAGLLSPAEMERYLRDTGRIFSSGLTRGVDQTGLGVAIDIGTTTVTAALIDLASGEVKGKASAGNGQIRYAGDVINRIIQQSRPHGVEKLRHAVREETIIPILEELSVQAGAATTDITRCTIAGNTTMQHLFVGADAQSIRLEPFVPEFLELHGKTAADLGLPIAPDAPVVFAPNVGSYVGGDISAGVLDTMMWDSDELTLFIDLGTNGELVLGNRDYLLCCACSAGPAFEGGEISCGMRATDGAIEEISIDDATHEPRYEVIGGGKPLGICGSGLIDTVAELFHCGIISPKGRFIHDEPRVIRDEYGTAEYVLAYPDQTEHGKAVTINETDINNFIRAKGAIFSAVRTMLKGIDLPTSSIERVMIAGGIGSGINMANAISIGMLPKIGLERYGYIGNSSLTGACAMLVSKDAENKVFEIGRNMTYLELSTYPGYMDEFVAACFLPHTDASLFA